MVRIWPRVLFALLSLDGPFSMRRSVNYEKMQFDPVFPGPTQSVHAPAYSKSRPENAFPYMPSFLIPETQAQKYTAVSSPAVMSPAAPTASATEVAAS